MVLRRLKRSEHMRCAEQLAIAEDALLELAAIVRQPRYIDRVLQVARIMQRQLVAPMNEAWGADEDSYALYRVTDYSVGPAKNAWKMRLR